MHPTQILLLALSALPFTLSAPTGNTTLPLEKRYNGPSIGSFISPTCSGQPLTGHMKHPSWSCFTFQPMSDNVGINWGGDRALGINFFTDKECQTWATKTVWSPANPVDDNHGLSGKGGAGKCLSFKANGGNWRSAAFVFDDEWNRAVRGKANHGH